jgi:hypothetical protein
MKEKNSMPLCKDCWKKLDKKNWPHWRRKVRHQLCYACGLARYRKRYKKISKQMCERQRVYRRRCKEELIAAYGGKCICCGEAALEFLTMAHLNNDGAKHRREIGGSCRMQSWLKKNKYPKGYSILCFNCNAADFYYGQCPHKKSFRLLNGSVVK